MNSHLKCGRRLLLQCRYWSTIPSSFGARVPNLATNKSACSADVWSFWTLHLGPVLLRQRFRRERYYNHFVKLVKLLHICLQFEITVDEIQTVREGFSTWLLNMRRSYRSSTTELHTNINKESIISISRTVCLHAWSLYMPPAYRYSIEASGPVWATWAFPWSDTAAP